MLISNTRTLAQTPISLYNNFTGKYNYVVMGGTLRCCDNATDACTANNSSSCPLTIPNGATIVAAYLYWAGSGATPDPSITLATPISSMNYGPQRAFTMTYTDAGTTYQYFSGFADITSQVTIAGSNTYTFSNLAVSTGNPWCNVQLVYAGWAAVVIYALPTEIKHSINIYDGFENFYGSQITFNPGNFFVPYSVKDGKLTHFTWEGDSTNSGSYNGYSEQLVFKTTTLSDALNPVNNQFNSISTGLPSGYQRTPGVDIDTYVISSYLASGDTNAVSTYSSGGDRVFLNCEIISIADTTSADLAVSKSHSPTGNPILVGTNEDFTLAVTNNGPDSAAAVVRDSIPGGIQVNSIDLGGYWTVDSSVKPIYVFTHPAFKVPPIGALPSIVFHTTLTGSAYPTKPQNLATISCPFWDRRPWNNSSLDSFTINTPLFSTSTKTAVEKHPGASIPGDTITYTIAVKNTGNYIGNSVAVVDSEPTGVKTIATSVSGSPTAVTGTVSGNVTTFSTFNLAVGSTETITYKARVDSTITPGPALSYNRAHIRCYSVVDQLLTASITGKRPYLWVRKTETPTHATPGDTLAYTLKYGNIGNDTAPIDSVVDFIPSNTTYVTGSVTTSGGGTVAYDGTNNRILGSKASTAAGDTNNIITFKVRVNSPLAVGATYIPNNTTVYGVKSPPMSGAVIDTINSVSSLSSIKYGPTAGLLLGSPTPADTITYIFRDTVAGKGLIDSVYLNDTLTSGLTYLSSTGGGSAVGQVVKWNLGTMNPGAILTETLKVRTTLPAYYQNYARLTYRQNVSGFSTDTITTRVYLPHTATLTQTTPIIPGQPVIVTVNDTDIAGRGTIYVAKTNVRTGEIENDTLKETALNSGIFKDTMKTVFGTVTNGNNNGSFAVQAGDTIRGSYVDTVNASGAQQTLTANTRVNGGYTAVLGVNPALVAAGNNLVWTINDTDLNHNASAVETYSYLLISSAGDSELVVFKETGINTGIFTDTIATQYGSSVTKNDNIFEVLPAQILSLIYRDTLTKVGNTVMDTTKATVGTVTLSTSTKTFTDINGGQSIPGDSIRYIISVTNTGTVAATNVLVTDTIPSHVKVKNGTISGGGTLASGVISWPAIASLAVSATQKDTVIVIIDSTVANNGTITNNAAINANGIKYVVSVPFTVVNVATLMLRKTVDKSSGAPGDTLTYTLKYGNIGTDSARTVAIYDTIPANTAYVTGSVTGAGASYDPGNSRIVVSRALVAQGDTSSIVTFKVKVNTLLTVGANTIKNAATETATNAPASKRDSVTSTITATVNFGTSSKTYQDLNGGSQVSGDSILYTIKVRNTGNQAAVNVVVYDTLSTHVKVKTGTISGTWSYSSGVITWSAPSSIAAGDSASYTVTVIIDSTVANGGTVTNTARIVSTGGGPQIVSTSFTTVNQSALFLRKAVNKSSGAPGDTLTYTLKYGDIGTDSARTVAIYDTIPANTAYITGSVTGAGASYDPGNSRIVVSRALIAQGDTSSIVTFKVKVDAPLTVGTTTIKNAATETATNAPASKRDSVTSTITATVNFGTSSKTYQDLNGGSQVSGDSILYTIKVRNTGNQAAVNVVVYDTLSTHVKVKTGTISGTWSYSSGVITWSAPSSIAAGDSASYTVTVIIDSTVANGGTVTNTARIVSTGGGPQIVSTSFTVVNVAALFLRKSVDKSSGAPGDTLTYTLKYGDIGTDSARTVAIYDTIPANTAYVTGSVTGTGASYDLGNSRIVVSRALIVQGDTSSSATFKVKVNAPLPLGITIVKNAATESAANAQTKRDSINCTVNAIVNLSTSSKSYQDLNGGQVASGDSVKYTITAVNSGNQVALNVAVTDTLPPHVTVKPGTISGSGTDSSNIIRWPVQVSLAADSSLTYTLTVVVDSSIADSAKLVNIARITANGVSQTVTATFTVRNSPVMTLVKSANKSSVIPGDTLTYTVTYGNSGNGTADSVTISDITPLHTAYVHNTVVLNGAPKTDAGNDDEVTVAYDTPVSGRASLTIFIGKVSRTTGGLFTFKVVVR